MSDLRIVGRIGSIKKYEKYSSISVVRDAWNGKESVPNWFWFTYFGDADKLKKGGMYIIDGDLSIYKTKDGKDNINMVCTNAKFIYTGNNKTENNNNEPEDDDMPF